MSKRGIPQKFPSLVANDEKYGALRKFLTTDCESGNIDVREAHYFFKEMLYTSPRPPMSWFSRLFSALVKSQHFSLPISFYKRLHVFGVLGLRSNFIIMNILLNCYSSMKLVSAGYSALGLIFKAGHRPDVFSFNSLIKGLCLEEKVVEAVGLLPKMSRLGCLPDVITYTTITDGLCKTGNVATALELHRLMLTGKCSSANESCKPSTVSYTLINTIGKNERISPNVLSYTCLIDGLCRSGMDEDASSLLNEMIDRGVLPNTVTYNTVINALCKKGKVEEAMEVLEKMISRGKFPDTVT